MKNIIIKRLLILIAIGFLSGGAITLYMYNKPHKNYSKIKPIATLTAEELFSEFELNESAANEKYLGKVIEVYGTVLSNYEAENGGSDIVFLDELFGVTCHINSADVEQQLDLIGSIKPGNTIGMKGRCDGMLTDVRLSACTITSFSE